jgi:hypothetical protein
MKKNLLILAIASLIAFYAGYSYKEVDLYTAVENHPRGGMGIPAQWLMMDTLVGWDKMMLIVGYADNVTVCQALVEIAKEDSPDRNFRCTDAN